MSGPTSTLALLSSLTPSSASRTWQSAPHPTLPLLATACADKTVRVYSLTSFNLLSTITGGHKRSVRCCAWKPQPGSSKSAPVLATGSFDASAAIWVGQAPHSADDADERLERQIGADGLGQEDAGEEDDYNFAVVLEGHDSEIKSLAWSVSGTYLATCSRDKSVWIWESLSASSANPSFGYSTLRSSGLEDEDEDNYETVAVLQEHDGDVKCVVWHPDDETCLASASYDEQVRVWREDPADGEWGCVAVLEGHKGTVWALDWEGTSPQQGRDRVDPASEDDKQTGALSGPRLVTCSDDKTVRVWRRRPKVRKAAPSGPRIPSIIRSTSQEEEWFEEAQLPKQHERAIYAVAWSKQTGRIASAGSDGRILVYEERDVAEEGGAAGNVATTNGDTVMANGISSTDDAAPTATDWSVIAEIEGAHGVFEVNHICWSKRWDRGKTGEDEEVIISTGDDGEVKVWTVGHGTA